MKLWHYIVGAVVIAGLLVGIGYFIGYHARGTGTVIVSGVDTTIVHEYIHDTTLICDTIVYKRTDTLFITEDTPLGDIPVRTSQDRDSIPLRVGDATMYMPYNLSVVYRGLLYKTYLTTFPRPYTVTLPKPKEKLLAPYVACAVMIDRDKDVSALVESGLEIKNRVHLFGAYDGEFRAGIRATLK
jgi:hypothetical protein